YEEHSEVINHTNSLDISLSFAVNNRWSVSATLPLVHSTRSSLYEHGFDGDGDENPDIDVNGDGELDDDPDDRYTTRAYGIGDLRLTGYYRALDPLRHPNRNVVVGLGLKFPTGQDGATDVFYRENGPDERVVDQSIQPGDGGWGINTELQFFSEIIKGFGAYVNGFYLFNPMDTNHVDRGRGRYGVDRFFSVADQYLARGGFYYRILKTGLTPNLGIRLEGVPSEDLLGKDSGYRRPGYTFSIEPGLTLQRKIHALELNVPVALIRNRPQSYADKVRTEETGVYVNGDAAFADYLILLTYSVKFGGK
ncbi:MAG TPA: hypothetical protein VNJ07_12720, partial [Chitinophagales bacterium]|nr:hypothetical protein [Chitinophagales bacterium]